MPGTVVELTQGSAAWHAFRLTHHGASEAGVMLGVSRKVKRNEMLRMKHRGVSKEFSDWLQKHVLDYGHEVEAKARPLVEELIGDTLYPVTFEMGKLSASCDGLTLDGSIAFEHKQWNAEYGALVRSGEVPEEHMPQCQQVLLVTGAERLIFVVSNGTLENFAYVWVYPDAEYQARIRAGWEQFDRDLETYVDEPIKPQLVAEAVPALPAVVYTIDRGTLAVQSNIDAFRTASVSLIERSKGEMITDQDFVDRKGLCSKFREAETMLKAKADEVVGQIQDVAKLSTDLRDIAELFRVAAIAGEKLVESETKNRKEKIVAAGREALKAYHTELTQKIGKPYLPELAADFASVTKNLRSLDSYKNAVDTVVANAKIAADKTVANITANLSALREKADGYQILFADTPQLVLKEVETVALIIDQRVREAKEAEAQRLEAERQRIRQEEEARAQREVEQKAEAERARIRAEEQAKAAEEAHVQREAMERAAQSERESAQARNPEPRQTFAFPGHPDYPRPDKAPAVDTGARITLGQINTAIAPLSISQSGLVSLGIESVGKERAAILYRESDLPRIFAAIIELVTKASAMKLAA